MIPISGRMKIPAAALLASFLLVSCSSDEEQVAQIKEEVREMRQKIEEMERDIFDIDANEIVIANEIEQKVPVLKSITDAKDRVVVVKTEIDFNKGKLTEVNGLLEAMTIRRDGMKAKFDRFRNTHPIE